MIKKIKNSKFGKFLRRVVGEDAGAVMMEYVILAVLIAAAAVVAIAYFGRNIASQANTASSAVAGDGKGASEQAQKIQNQQQSQQSTAASTADKFSTEAASTVGKQASGGGSAGGGSAGSGN